MVIVSNQDIENVTDFGLIHEELVKNTPFFWKVAKSEFFTGFSSFL